VDGVPRLDQAKEHKRSLSQKELSSERGTKGLVSNVQTKSDARKNGPVKTRKSAGKNSIRSIYAYFAVRLLRPFTVIGFFKVTDSRSTRVL
jgi:hypothetical protein